MEIQRGEVAYPRSHSLLVAELGLNTCSELDYNQTSQRPFLTCSSLIPQHLGQCLVLKFLENFIHLYIHYFEIMYLGKKNSKRQRDQKGEWFLPEPFSIFISAHSFPPSQLSPGIFTSRSKVVLPREL